MKHSHIGLYIFTALLFAVVAVILLFVVLSSGKTKPFLKDGKEISGSINEKRIIYRNDAALGLVIRSRDEKNPVLLFVQSGPGSNDLFLNEKYPQMNLEDYFTVVYLDYRGMCLVYDPALDPQSVTTDVMMNDIKAVTDYLKSRFVTDKIYLMGFSGGTHIALQAAQKFPEDYKAYFAMAQVVTSDFENDTYIYNFIKKTFTERKDSGKLKKLESIVNHIDGDKVECTDWMRFIYLLHQAGGGTIKDKDEFTSIDIPIFMSRCYNLKEKFCYVPSIKMYQKTPFYEESRKRDYRKDIPELQIPVYFISGDTDYNCPWPLVKDYYEKIDAPEKDFILVPDSAHSPLWENSKVVVEFMKGKTCTIELTGNPTTGYTWQYDIDNKDIVTVKEDVIYLGAENQCGAPSRFVYTINAVKEGSALITFNYSRPWESNPPAETRVYRIDVDQDKRVIITEVKK